MQFLQFFFLMILLYLIDLRTSSNPNPNPIWLQPGLSNSNDSVLKFERSNLWSDHRFAEI